MDTVVFVAQGLQQLWLAEALRTSPWLYPIVNGVHILTFALLFGAIAVADWSLIRFGRLSAGAQRLAIPAALWGFAGATLTGTGIFAVQAVEYVANPFLWLKAGLIAAAGLNALALHSLRRRALSSRLFARCAGTVSILFWSGVILSGRMLAYY